MCGSRIIDDFINLDMQLLKGVDVIAYIDPFRPIIPFRDDSFEYIYFNNGPDHILNINQLIQEMYRISKDKAESYLLTPGYLDPNSWNDPTHYSHWTRSILQFYTKKGLIAGGMSLHCWSTRSMAMKAMGWSSLSEWSRKSPRLRSEERRVGKEC